MPEIPVVSLDFRWQKQVESARQSFERGNYRQAIDTAAPVLAEFPACLAVRRLIRAAQLRQPATGRGGALGRFFGLLSNKSALISAAGKLKEDPVSAVKIADGILIRNAANFDAALLLGRASAELGWHETAVYAYECAREQKPAHAPVLLDLGRALLAVGRAPEALSVARELVQAQPNDAEVQALFRNASVAVTVATGKWDAGGDYRSKLENEQKAAALEQAAKKFGKPGKPKNS